MHQDTLYRYGPRPGCRINYLPVPPKFLNAIDKQLFLVIVRPPRATLASHHGLQVTMKTDFKVGDCAA